MHTLYYANVGILNPQPHALMMDFLRLVVLGCKLIYFSLSLSLYRWLMLQLLLLLLSNYILNSRNVTGYAAAAAAAGRAKLCEAKENRKSNFHCNFSMKSF